MIKVRFFARIRETLGTEGVDIEFDSSLHSIADVIDRLCDLNSEWGDVIKDASVLVALNQEMTHLEAKVRDGAEVAFFPPVTGG